MDLLLAQSLATIVNTNTNSNDAKVLEDYSSEKTGGKTTAGITGATTEEILVALVTAIIDYQYDELIDDHLRQVKLEDIPESFNTESLGKGKGKIIY